MVLTPETITAEFLVIQKKAAKKYPDQKQKLQDIILKIKKVVGYYGMYCIHTAKKPGMIYISHLLMTNSKVLRDTLRHEFAHAVCYLQNKDLNHSDAWIEVCKNLGIKDPKISPDLGISKAQLRNIKIHERNRAKPGT